MESFIKSPIYLEKYVSDGGFWLLEAKQDWIAFRYNPSSYVVPGEAKPRPTVDIILVGAIFIELPTNIIGVSISKPRDVLSRSYAEKYDRGFDFSEDERVYAIESEGNRFHVVTGNLWIHVHKERISELPLNHFYSSDMKSYNDYLDKYVESWIKIK